MGTKEDESLRLDRANLAEYVVSMAATYVSVTQEAMVLPPEQRLELARHLLESVDPAPEPGAEEAWQAEIAQRLTRFRAGESVAVPAEEVFARLRKITSGQ